MSMSPSQADLPAVPGGDRQVGQVLGGDDRLLVPDPEPLGRALDPATSPDEVAA
jgi:hypothetical protein